MHLRGIRRTALLFALLLSGSIVLLRAQQPAPQKMDSLALQDAHAMLHQGYDEIRKNYYDPTFHGVDLDKTYQQYNARLDASTDVNDAYRVIEAFMLSLHDSHTNFMPPKRANPSTPGFSMKMIGDKCLITRIRPSTDAASKLHVGDQVLTLDGFKVELAHFDEMLYFIQVLSPGPYMVLDLLNPAGEHRKETVNAEVHYGKYGIDIGGSSQNSSIEKIMHLRRSRFFDIGDTFIWKMPTFLVPFPDMDTAADKAKKYKNLIIDLRGNSGGAEDTVKAMLGHFFDHEIKLGDRVTRKETKPVIIKPRKPFYSGDVIVLVDHNSASASEIFARVIQLEHRGKVIGDNSAGAVMEAQAFGEVIGADARKIIYGIIVTRANLLMTDGKSLENVGVIPDELLLPTAQDLAAGKDPVLSHAVDLTGAKLDPVAAGKLFPFEWPDL
ncbi:MAG: S41 family peptidase [Terracidiphilus sp.]|jgi:C-terminal processing protease CtpA/Prc